MADRDAHAPPAPGSAQSFLAGGGELGALIRAHNWKGTSLGPPETWPQSLLTAVRIMLTSRQPMWIGWGGELIYLYNDPYKSIIGGKHPWALGKPTSEVWREIWADIGPMLDQAMGGVEGTFVEEQLLIMERNGYPEETYYTFSYSPIPDDQGAPGGIICANSDDTQGVIGERQLALLRELAARTVDARDCEEACRRAADSLATDPKDLPFALVYVAEPGEETLALVGAVGFTPGAAAAPLTLRAEASEVWPVKAALKARAPQLVDLNTERHGVLPRGAWARAPSKAVVLPLTNAGETGRTGVVILGLSPFRLFDAGYKGFVGLVAGQISAAISSAEAFEEARRRADALAALDQAKTVFFTNISHEFRTPLTLMLAPLESLLEDSALTGAGREHVEVAHRNGMRLLRLVNTLLDFSRLEAGRSTARYQPIALESYLPDLVSTFRSATDRAGLTLDISCEPLPQRFWADPTMLEKIVLNLVSNAFKFTLQGGIRVGAGPVGADRVRITVQDTGAGIPTDELSRLFDRFHRVEGTPGRSFEGSGIGLALVSELVALHGGQIQVTSAQGVGSTFTLDFPLGAKHLPSDRLTDPSETVATAAQTNPFVQEALRWLPEMATSEADGPAADERQRVLVADDNADMRDYIARLLRQEGYEAVVAEDGVAALAMLRECRPDLLLTDVMMPRMNGFELLTAIRKDPGLADLPVLVLSARAGEDAEVEGLDAGADDYLVKPFSSRELLARVGANLALSTLRRAALAESKARTAELQALIDAVPVAVWFTRDPDARSAWSNAFAARMMDLSLEQNPSLSAPEGERPTNFRVFHGGHPAATEDLPLQRAGRGEIVRNCEEEVRFEDGRVIHLLTNAVPIRDEAGDVQGAVAAAVEITEAKRAEELRTLLINELNHRVKNTLATVQSVAMQTLQVHATPETFMEAFDSRLLALSRVHDLLTRQNWSGADLRAVVEDVIAPYRNASANQFSLAGPSIILQPQTALSLSMAFHELATNAAKYGALSRPEGTVEMDWSHMPEDGRLMIVWRERGGPPVSAPSRRGFGTRLIERGLARELSGRVEIRYDPAGVVCEIVMPLAGQPHAHRMPEPA